MSYPTLKLAQGARLLTLGALVFVTSCQSALTATPLANVPTRQPVVESQPIAGGPVLLREGLTLRKVMETGAGNNRLVQDPTTGDLYLLNSGEGIFRLKDLPGAASKEKVASIRELKGRATGIAFGPDGVLYVVMNTVVDKTQTQVTVRKGTPNGEGRFTWETLATTDPYPLSNTYYDHLYNGLIVSPDGQWIYLGGGSRTEHGEVETNGGAFPDTREVALTARVLRLPTSAVELTLPNDEAALTAGGYIFARGTRNPYDLAFAPNGDLFGVDNGPDADFPDELNWLREGQHYGFPWRFGIQANPQTAADYDPSQDKHLPTGYYAVDNQLYHNDPGFPPAPGAFADPVLNLGPDATQYRGDDGQAYEAYAEGKSLSTFTPHRSPLGLVFATDPKLPAEWLGEGDTLSAFILSWGAVGGTLSDKGQDLLHLRLTKTGDNYQALTNQIARGFQNPIDAVLIGNQLYVLEFGGNGAIWELTFK